MYRPPFTVSTKAINLIAMISSQIERYSIKMEQEDTLRLRKVNRIKTIHSSLAIEGNNLSEGEVQAILEGKKIVAPLKEIQEVRNAIKTYELYPKLNPFSIQDLLLAHGTMMAGLVDEAGVFRSGGVGVFDGEKAIHIAPPASRVKELMNDLFSWLENTDDHLLIRSCVFHYEFEFIHPFADGNGRIGRLWQSLILGQLNPIFEHLPVENMVYANQQAYYDAINKSSDLGGSGPFIDFMLEEILNALVGHQGKSNAEIADEKGLNYQHERVLGCLRADRHIAAMAIAEDLGMSARQVERILADLKKKGIIQRKGANRNGYWEVLD
ncbi:MAG: Fic family protein [Bacteroidales bacterium]|nr:Fic family protein [Bacteroidales bacterium]MBO7604132.1 Fic family protein [Bacteroidales bacterium]